MAKSTTAPLSFVSTARKSPYKLKFMQNPPYADFPYKRHKTTSTVSEELKKKSDMDGGAPGQLDPCFSSLFKLTEDLASQTTKTIPNSHVLAF